MMMAPFTCIPVVDLVWFGLVWFGLVWFGLVWIDLALAIWWCWLARLAALLIIKYISNTSAVSDQFNGRYSSLQAALYSARAFLQMHSYFTINCRSVTPLL